MKAVECTVLGATGFIGRQLVATLTDRGKSVWAPEKQSPEIFKKPLGTVFYCIGLTGDYTRSPRATINAHAAYLAEILENASFEHLVYLSSTRLYDGMQIGSADGSMSLNLNPNNPRHLYDLSKALGENLCLTASKLRASVARLSCVYNLKCESPGFLSQLLWRYRTENSLTVDSSPNICRDYISLEDTISSLIAIGEHQNCQIFNVASGTNTYNKDISNLLSKYNRSLVFGNNDMVGQIPQCNIEKIYQLGIRPASTLNTIEEFIKNL